MEATDEQTMGKKRNITNPENGVESTLDKGLFGAVSKIFETSSCQRNDLAFCIFCVFFVRLEVLVRNGLDHLHKVVGFGYVGN